MSIKLIYVFLDKNVKTGENLKSSLTINFEFSSSNYMGTILRVDMNEICQKRLAVTTTTRSGKLISNSRPVRNLAASTARSSNLRYAAVLTARSYNITTSPYYATV